jgi:hypothetical protein
MRMRSAILLAALASCLFGGRAAAAGDHVPQPQPLCAREDAGHVVLWRGHPGGVEAVVRAAIAKGLPAGPKTVAVGFFGPGCRTLDDITMQGDSALVRPIELDKVEFLLVTADDHGGSGSTLTHALLEVTPAGLKRIDLPDFQHSNMGGLFLGNLGNGSGFGAVVWDAEWTAGAHYDPHPYTFRYYVWENGRFAFLRKTSTTRSYDPSDPDAAPCALRLSFRDLSMVQAMPSAY